MGKRLRDWRTEQINGKGLSQWREDEWTEEIYGSDASQHERFSSDHALENDEISSWEAAFMDGYDQAA